MSAFRDWPLGASLCFRHRYDKAELYAAAKAGITCVELSFLLAEYDGLLRLSDDPARVGGLAEEAGVSLWSMHLPFERGLDYSCGDLTRYDNVRGIYRRLIDAAAKAGVKVAVVHPNGGMFEEEERAARLPRVKERLRELAEYAAERGMALAVENLSHSLLRHSDEAEYVLDGNPGVGLVFDTNHLLIQDCAEYVRRVGEHIITLHVSDYDFIHERHRLPLRGKNDWRGIVTALEDCGYNGPWLYEVGSGGVLDYADIASNYRALSKLLDNAFTR